MKLIPLLFKADDPGEVSAYVRWLHTDVGQHPNVKLRLADLKARRPVSDRLMNMKIPVEFADAIDKLTRRLNTSKTAVVVALLNEGLNAAARVKVRK